MKALGFLSLLGSLALVVACGQRPEQISANKVVFGSNDLSYYTTEDNLSGSIGIIAVGCTATHVGNGYVITAGHCVSTNYCTPEYDVFWTYLSTKPDPKSKSACLEVIDHEQSTRTDYALIRVSNPPPNFLKLNTNTSDRPKEGNPITIYSHPNLRPLSWSGWCSVDQMNFRGNHFSYTCDTESGSSGAAVLNKNMEVVGIHNFGSADHGLNAASYVADVASLRAVSQLYSPKK